MAAVVFCRNTDLPHLCCLLCGCKNSTSMLESIVAHPLVRGKLRRAKANVVAASDEDEIDV